MHDLRVETDLIERMLNHGQSGEPRLSGYKSLILSPFGIFFLLLLHVSLCVSLCTAIHEFLIMASNCAAAPASLALPAVIRSIFAPNALKTQRVSPLSIRRARAFQPRSFSSAPALYEDQEPSHHANQESQENPNTGSSRTKKPEGPGRPANRIESGYSYSSPKKPRDSVKPSGGRKSAKNAKKQIKSEILKMSRFKNARPEEWQVQKGALEKKFPTGWNPQKKLSPDALDGIRQLHATAPERFTTSVLAEEFKVSPESIRRILKSKWKPSGEEAESRRKRWERRHERIWSHMAELGLRPMTKAALPLSDSKTLYRDAPEDVEDTKEGEDKGDQGHKQ